MCRLRLFILLCWLTASDPLLALPQPDAIWAYKQIDGKDLQMSVFLPEGYEAAEVRFPSIVIFHGGSWRAGEASWHYPDAEYYSRRGMIAVSVDYRLKDRDNIEVPLECVKDAKSAVRFLRQNAKALKVDPDRIVAAGGSAGGQLAAALATITAPETNDGDYDLSISCVPQLVVLWNPWFRCEARLSPPQHIKEGLPPFITFLGDNDVIPVEEVLSFHDSLIAAGLASRFYVGKGGKHGFCNGRNPTNPYFYWSVELIDRFLVEHGILTGDSLVEIPEGVRQLTYPEDYTVYPELLSTSRPKPDSPNSSLFSTERSNNN